MEAAKRDIPLGVLLKKSLYIAATDPRNILILVLSALVVFLSMQAAAPGLQSSGLGVAYFDMPMVDNFTVAPVYPPREVVHSTTTTATTTATYTAFILETIAALPTATAAPSKGQSTLEPEIPTEQSHFDETQQLKNTIFAASIQILDSAFEKMSAIVSSAAQAEQEASGSPLIPMPAPGSPDDEEAGVDRERSAGEDSGRSPVGEAENLTAELPNVETMVPSGDNPDTRSAPALAGQHSLSTTNEVTEAMDTSTEAVGEQMTESAAAASFSPMADIRITLAADNEQVSIHRTHPAQIFTSADSLCPAGDEDHEDAPMTGVGSDADGQSTRYQPATDYFSLAPTCPAEAHGETPMEVDDDDADEDAAEAFMEAVVLEGSTEEIVVEQVEGAELAEHVVQLPNEVESPAEEAFQGDSNVEEEIAVVLDV
ncbi:hypothetical protein MPH_10211 [Macrophomina phaseolina MS6]|uniref:Uncharacterized protein n=1 Tax=Macrophomina phaseolina (strain MS6) TaxID=1126212 RepID=K2RIH9_MACPH|nr:hypothetical protein MPH_10211 [Macrophomina phaseolina MS6]